MECDSKKFDCKNLTVVETDETESTSSVKITAGNDLDARLWDFKWHIATECRQRVGKV